MSTKIYNGYKFKKNPTTVQIRDFCKVLCDKMKPIAQQAYHEIYVHEMINLFDKNQYGYWEEGMYYAPESGMDISSTVKNYIRARINHMNTANERDPDVDFGFQIYMFPLKNREEMLILLYAENSALTKAFNKLPEIEEYHYQNQSDKPSKISAKKWEQRRLDWDDALGGDGYGTALECGISYKPYDLERIGTFQGSRKTPMYKLIDSLDIRAERIANNQMGTAYDQKYPSKPLPTNPTTEEKNNRHDEMMSQYWRFRAYCKSDDGLKELNEKIKVIKPQLKIISSDSELFDLKLQPHNNIIKIYGTEEKGKPYWL